MVLTVRLWSELCVFSGCWTTKKRDENLVTGIVNINFVYTVCVCVCVCVCLCIFLYIHTPPYIHSCYNVHIHAQKAEQFMKCAVLLS